mmetsp:Transcript_15558/g.32870  ORF Transcript_15558/g.32870 Transcript_15558/m.32870 type:complete len:219 (-) Transcript_15558:768-1424(-)
MLITFRRTHKLHHSQYPQGKQQSRNTAFSCSRPSCLISTRIPLATIISLFPFLRRSHSFWIPARRHNLSLWRGTVPIDQILTWRIGLIQSAQQIFAIGFLKGCSHHLQVVQPFLWRKIPMPMSWYRIVNFIGHAHSIEVDWTIMHEKTGIISSNERLRPPMETFARFIKQNIARFQIHLIGIALKILNDNGPRLGIVGSINVKNATDDVRARFIHVHQ